MSESFSKVKYRPALDGVRTLAVYAVILFHAGMGFFPNGYIGVDMFFVLSGFLVTTVLLTEYQNYGRISLLDFYARRAKRLLPGAMIVILFSVLFGSVFLDAVTAGRYMSDSKAAIFYHANFHFIGQSQDYFAVNDTESPLLHYWSLSIEEQFYFAFPLILFLVLVAKKRYGKTGGILVLFPILGYSLYAQLLNWFSSSRPYFGTDTRIYQMIIGVGLAYALFYGMKLPEQSAKLMTPLLGVFILWASPFFDVSPSERGIGAALISVLIIAANEAKPFKPLEHHWMCFLGKISYGTYLWHWPIIVFTKIIVTSNPIVLLIVGAGGGTFMGWISSITIEKKFRKNNKLGSKITIGLFTSVSLLVAFVGFPLLSNILGVEKYEAAQERLPAYFCEQENLDECVLHDGTGLKVHLVGDSHARGGIPMLKEIAVANNWNLTATVDGGCPWQTGVTYWNHTRKVDCFQAQNSLLHNLSIIQPDVLILWEKALDDPMDYVTLDYRGNEILEEQSFEVISETSQVFMESVPPEIKIVIIEPTPLTAKENNPLTCAASRKPIAECSFAANNYILRSEQLFRTIAEENSNITTIDMDSVICPEKLCKAEEDGIVVWRDSNHITNQFSEYVVYRSAPLLEEIGKNEP